MHAVVARAAHVVKGASSNLMCGQLRDTSSQLERSAQERLPRDIMLTQYQDLLVAMNNYRGLCEHMGV